MGLNSHQQAHSYQTYQSQPGYQAGGGGYQGYDFYEEENQAPAPLGTSGYYDENGDGGYGHARSGTLDSSASCGMQFSSHVQGSQEQRAMGPRAPRVQSANV